MKRSKYEKIAYEGPRPPASPRALVTLPRVVIASTILLVAFVVGMQVRNSMAGSASASTPPDSMEKVFYNTQGTPIPKEAYVVLGVEVADPAVNLGTFPLNTGVTHEFKLRNTGTATVFLGRPEIEVLQGCCPSDPVLKATKINPGEEVPLEFSLPMGMHAGMDGQHLFRLSVQMGNDAGEKGIIQVYVKADFRAGASGGTDHANHGS
jgi:hypothetical protein